MGRKKKKPEKYSLALSEIGTMVLTPDEKLEINRLSEKDNNRELIGIVFRLRKKGFGYEAQLAMTQIDARRLRNINTIINMSEFLVGQINMALTHMKSDIQEIKKSEFDNDNETFNDNMLLAMENKIKLLLNSMTVEKINNASLEELSKAFAVIFDKYRTASGKSNINIMGVQALVGNSADDMKKMKELEEQISKIERLLKHNEVEGGSTEGVNRFIQQGAGATVKNKTP